MQVGGVEGERARLVSRASEGHTDSIFFERSPPACRRFAPCCGPLDLWTCGPDRDSQPDSRPLRLRLSGGAALGLLRSTACRLPAVPASGVRNPASPANPAGFGTPCSGNGKAICCLPSEPPWTVSGFNLHGTPLSIALFLLFSSPRQVVCENDNGNGDHIDTTLIPSSTYNPLHSRLFFLLLSQTTPFASWPAHRRLPQRACPCAMSVCVCDGGPTPAYITERCIVRRVVMQ